MPVGITYEHFSGAGKLAMINYGFPFNKQHIKAPINTAGFVVEFNQNIHNQTLGLAYVNPQLVQNTPAHVSFSKHWQNAGKNCSIDYLHQAHSSLPKTSIAGVVEIVLWPIYFLTGVMAKIITKGNQFYDSISFGLFALLWPIYGVLVVKVVGYFLQ